MLLEDNFIYIVPIEKKNKYLLEISKENVLKNIKIYTLEEVVDKYGKYNEKAIVYLMQKYNYKYNNAKELLKNIRYVDEKKYGIKKLDFLVNLKEELKDYFEKDVSFIDYLKKQKIIVKNYNTIDNYSKRILEELNAKIEIETYNNYEHTVYGFDNIFDEINFVSSKIRELLDNNIDINKIKIVNYSSEYDFILPTIFKLYDLNINEKCDSIYSTRICKNFFSMPFEDFKNSVNLKDEDNLYVYNKIIDVINRYNFEMNEQIKKEIFINEFKNIKSKSIKYKNSIEIKDINNIEEDEYVFLIGFNERNIPKVYKDEDYLNDFEKEYLNLEKSYEKNEIERNNVIHTIKNIKNLIITYKLKSPFEEYLKSNLIDELGYNDVFNEVTKYTYSSNLNKLVLSKELDNFMKYSTITETLELLNSNYKNNDYLTYDNKYKKIEKEKLYSHLKNELVLSYSSIDNYYKCKFKYYLNNILKLDKYEETFAMYIGNLFHYILSIAFNDDFDFEKEYNNYIKEKEFTSKESFFIDVLKKDLLFIIETIKKQYSHSNFKKALYEEKYSINKDSVIKVSFIGFIDKLLYEEYNGKTLLVIVDYKTGDPELNLNNSIYGLNLQLPVYLYLSKNNNIVNSNVVGFYLQKILNKEIPRNKNKTYEMLKEEQLKLQGYSIYNEEYLNEFDDSYEHSKVIKSLEKGKDDFKAYSKLLTEKEMDELYKLVDSKINEARDNILEADFKINPKRIGVNNVSCTFCKYKDICYMNESNIEELDEVKNLDFLGGNKDA